MRAPLFYVTFLCTNLPPVVEELQMAAARQGELSWSTVPI